LIETFSIDKEIENLGDGQGEWDFMRLYIFSIGIGNWKGGQGAGK
jgi:hypothetical protein